MPDGTCPSDEFFGNPVQHITGDKYYKQIAEYTSAGCALVSIILCGGLALSHLCLYRNRHEQRQIVRIIAIPAVICIFNFFGVRFYGASGFLRPIGEYYDCIALASLYLLFVTYATPPESRGNPRQIFDNMPALHASYSYQSNTKNSDLPSYYKTYAFVFQIIPVRFITTIATMAVYGTVCQQLETKKSGHTIISVISTFSTIICFISVLHMMKFVKPALVGKSPILKTIALKGLVAFSVTLELVFSILKTTNAISPTKYLNLMDWFIGTPQLMTCCAGLIFSIVIVIAYRPTPYTATALPGVEKRNFFAALIDVLNFTDIFIGGLSKLPSAFSMWKSGGVPQGEVSYEDERAAQKAGSEASGYPMVGAQEANVGAYPPPAYGRSGLREHRGQRGHRHERGYEMQ